jgi:hypothetical protein
MNDEQTNKDVRIGNKYWLMRASSGRDALYSTPDELWQDACEYFEWVNDNPLYEDKLISFQGEATHEPVAKMRAMTVTGLCVFLDCTFPTWLNYKAKPDFFNVVNKIENIIKTQKFEGAAADLLNSNIIARDLGLADKQELTGKDGAPMEMITNARDEIASRIASLSARSGTPENT